MLVYVDILMQSLKKTYYYQDTIIYLFCTELFYARIVKMEVYGN